MELLLTPEQEARLVEMAEHEGKTPSQFVVDAVINCDTWDEHLRKTLRERIAEADAGVFIEEEEMDVRFQKMLQA